MLSSAAFDITVIQKGDTYVVSGKDALALHAKLLALPPDTRNLIIGEVKNGAFTLQKAPVSSQAQPQAASAAG